MPNAQKDGTKCPDDSDCTVNELCKGGKCVIGADKCKCDKDADCKDDGNKCNGTMFCDQVNDTCKVDPTSVVVCESVFDTACLKNACVPLSGGCTMTATEETKAGSCPDISGTVVPNCRYEVRGPNDTKLANIPCQDGNQCTAGDVCKAGKCTSGNIVCECATDADCLAKDDGNKCNGIYYCDKSKAKATCVFNPASAVLCPPVFGSPCLANKCDPVTGKCGVLAKADGAPCDDDKLCTIKDRCKAQKCFGTPNLCSDGQHCTIDKCFEATGCAHEKKTCDDGNACTLDSCDTTNGTCTNAAKTLIGKPCSDGDGCTIADACVLDKDGKTATCKAGVGTICDQKVSACAKAQCVSLQAGQDFKCVVVPKGDGAACDDGDACSLNSVCATGKCVTGAKQRLFRKLVLPSKGQNLRLDAVARWGNTYAIVGRQFAHSDGKISTSQWWWARVQPGGVVGEPKMLADGAGAHATTMGAVTSGDGVVIGGSTKPGSDAMALRLRALDGKGAAVWDKVYGNKGEETAFRRLRAHPSGGFLVAAEIDGSKGAQAYRIGSNGAVAWVSKLGGGANRHVRDIAPFGASKLAAVGTSMAADKGAHGWLVVLSDEGKVEAEYALGNLATQEILAAVPMGDGTLWAAGSANKDGAKRLWTLRVRPDGVPLWSVVHSSSLAPTDVVALTGDRVIATGETNPGGKQRDLWIGGSDGSGNRTWDATRQDSGEDQGRALAVTADGGAWVVGTASFIGGPYAGSTVGTLTRINAWGHTSCAQAGVCRNKALSDCADDDKSGGTCTRDRCDPTLGCQNVPVSAMRCPSPTGCSLVGVCSGKTCKPGADGKYFVKTLGEVKIHDVGGASIDQTGAAAWVGRQADVLQLHRTDRFGNHVGVQEIGPDKISTVPSVVSMAGGDVILTFSTHTGKTWISRRNGAGNAKWSAHLCAPSKLPAYNKHGTPASQLAKLAGWFPTCTPQKVTLTPSGKHIVVSGTSVGLNQQWWPSTSPMLKGDLKATRTAGWTRRVDVEKGTMDPLIVWGNHGAAIDLPAPQGWWYIRMYWSAGPVDIKPPTTPFPLSVTHVPIDDGALVVGGRESFAVLNTKAGIEFEKPRAYLRKVTATGKVVWAQHFGAVGATDIAALALAADGGLLALGKREVAGGAKGGWVMKSNSSGQLVWTNTLKLNGSMTPAAIVPFGNDVHLAATLFLGGQSEIWHGVVRVGGGLLRQSTYSAGVGAHVPLTNGNLRVLKTGEIFLAAQLVAGGLSSPVVIKASQWGHATCTDAGNCANTKLGGCDDSDLCTYDFCVNKDGKATCQHKPMLQLCADDNPCTIDTCNKLNGACLHTVNTCDDDDACTTDTCDATLDATTLKDGCKHAKVTCKDDGQFCTSNACDKDKGCIYPPANAGKPCIESTCKTGTCQLGSCKHDGKVPMLGCNATNPTTSCAALLKTRPDATDGDYWLDWDGQFGKPAKKFTCDMKNGGWTLLEKEDFEGTTSDWSGATLTTCGKLGKLALWSKLQSHEVYLIRKLSMPPHTQARVTFDFVAVDYFQYAVARLYANDVEVWNFGGHHVNGATNLCGGSQKDHYKQGVVRVFPHTKNALDIKFRGPATHGSLVLTYADNITAWAK